MIMSFSRSAFIILILLAVVPALALSQGAPCVPNRFFGEVTVNGNPAPTGLKVVARINGAEVSNTITVDGKYGYSPHVFDVPDNDNNCDNTAMVEFFIEGKAAGQATFLNGHITRLDLSATGVTWCGDGSCNSGETCSSCSKDCGSCSSSGGSSSGGGGGSGGGSGGGYVPPQECIPEWHCSSWSQCINGTQTRECLDIKECNADEGKPQEEQKCGLSGVLPESCDEGETLCVGNDIFQCDANSRWHAAESCESGCSNGACLEQEESESGQESPLTGFFLDPATLGYASAGIVIILIALYILWRRGSKT